VKSTASARTKQTIRFIRDLLVFSEIWDTLLDGQDMGEVLSLSHLFPLPRLLMTTAITMIAPRTMFW
jgi:hypothetical protein